jgi:hypothetical protein
VLTFKKLLIGGAAATLGAGGLGAATSVLAQVATPPTQPPAGGTPQPSGTTPVVPGQTTTTPPEKAFVSNFRRDADVTVTQRPREGYEARGLRMGTLLVYPQITVSPTYDDNIYATSTDTTSDTIWKIQPQVSVASDWNRHALSIYALANINQYSQHSTENTTDYTVGGNGRLDVDHATQVNGRLIYQRATEPRTSANSPAGALKPVRFDLWDVYGEGRHEFDRLLGSLRFDSQTYKYDSPPSKTGGTIDQSFRDRTVTFYGGRLDYAFSPKTAFFVDIQGEDHSQKHTSPADTTNRDSKGYQVLGGVDFEVTALMRGNLGFGYRRETFSDPSAKPFSGWSTDATLEWFPTQLTTVTFRGSRSVEDSAVPGSPAYLSANLSARVDHELLRNVIITGQAAYGDDKYAGINREDHRTSAGVGGSYLLNRNVGVTLTYNYSKQRTVTGVGNNFSDNRIMAGLTLQY